MNIRLTAVTHGRQCAFYWGSFVDSELHTFVDPLVAWIWGRKQLQVLLTIRFVQITIQTRRGLEHWPNNTHQEHEVGRGCRICVSWGGHLQGHSSQWVSCHQCTFTWTSFVDSRSCSIYTNFLLQIEVVGLWFTIFHLMWYWISWNCNKFATDSTGVQSQNSWFFCGFFLLHVH